MSKTKYTETAAQGKTSKPFSLLKDTHCLLATEKQSTVTENSAEDEQLLLVPSNSSISQWPKKILDINFLN